ncbi:MAG: hypothetical protein GC203_21620 [Phenylobacterium sp.]|uniref:hypothetical protein n=1 Tax=Phenylobacterium sp. TaxID=1871053 RepID=UPI0025E438A8|nr:hypothetical protein [Phenylobacterium sp.]MBI1200468.1 hypothetical protein [Phenylobacterium sp.]
MLGVLGIEFPAYARWLANRSLNPRVARLGYYISNEAQFVDPPSVTSDADIPALKAWMSSSILAATACPLTLKASRVCSWTRSGSKVAS